MSGAVWRQILGVSIWNCIVMAILIVLGSTLLDIRSAFDANPTLPVDDDHWADETDRQAAYDAAYEEWETDHHMEDKVEAKHK